MRKLWSLLLCLCFALTGCGGERGKIGERLDSPFEFQPGEDFKIRPLGPVQEPTHENLVRDVQSMLSAVQDSFEQMNIAASEKGAPAERAAQSAREICEARINELSEQDFTALEDDELMDILLEISDMITTLREARDAIDDLG